jgi:hypothetical protein
MNYFWTLCLFLFTYGAFSQKKLQGQVIDFDSSIPIAFAKITHENKTLTADWEGRFPSSSPTKRSRYFFPIKAILPIIITYRTMLLF